MDNIITLAARRTDEHPDWIGQYKPTIVLGCIVPAAVYLTLAILTSMHVIRTRSLWWGLVLPIGTVATGAGFASKLWQRSAMTKIMPFVVQQLFILVSPAAFLAWNYIIFGRLLLALNGVDVKDATLQDQRKRDLKSPYSFIPPRIVGRLFVWSDILTFVLQMGGGGLSAQGGDMAKYGSKTMLVGVIAQALSYVVFVVLVIYSNVRLANVHSSTYNLGSLFASLRKGGHPTARLFFCFYFSSIWILIRSVFRSWEMAQGHDGALASNETFLLLLDALPLALAVAIWCLYWPTGLIEATRKAALLDVGPSEYAPMAPLTSSEVPYNHGYGNSDAYASNEHQYGYKYEA